MTYVCCTGPCRVEKTLHCRVWLWLPIRTGLLTKSLALAQVVMTNVNNIDKQNKGLAACSECTGCLAFVA